MKLNKEMLLAGRGLAMVKMARLDEAAIANFQCFFGNNADEVISKVNEILGQYPEYDAVAKNGNNLLKQKNADALRKADKAKAHIASALKLLGQIDNQHPAISHSISELFQTALWLKLQNDDSIKQLAKDKFDGKDQEQLSAYIQKYRLTRSQLERNECVSIVSPLLDRDFLQMDGLLKIMESSLKVPFFQGVRSQVKAGFSGKKQYKQHNVEMLLKELERCWNWIIENEFKISGKPFSQDDFLACLHIDPKMRDRVLLNQGLWKRK